jgi:nitroimidazol reductase NimA-like FMN-containing flavoprotein (pyridoxamine 5'-phosphate oxidase superfamily)
MAKNNLSQSQNTKKYANKPRDEIRRKEYAVTDIAWIRALLTRGAFGSLGTAHNSQPFITPILYLYVEEEHAIYYHGARVGRMRANAELNPNVCFNVCEIGRILPAKNADDFNVEYNSVTVFGKAHLVKDGGEVVRILERLLDKYAPHLKPGEDYEHIKPEEINRTSVHKIDIEDWTGKQQKEDDDNPGAFYYEHLPVISRD